MEFQEEAIIKREKEIAGYILQDFSANQIAKQLGLSKQIVNAHTRNLMRKLNVKNLPELIVAIKEHVRK